MRRPCCAAGGRAIATPPSSGASGAVLPAGLRISTRLLRDESSDAAEFAGLKPLSSVPVQPVLVLGRLTLAKGCTPTSRPGQCRTT
jgi:hypothetical protein